MVIQAITHSLLQIVIGGNAAPEIPETYDAAVPEGINLLVLILNAGWSMLPIFILLFIAVYTFIGRSFIIYKAQREDSLLLDNINAAIKNGSIEDALQICRQKQTPVAKMLEKGIQRIGRPLSDISSAMQNTGRFEIIKTEKSVPRLATIAVLALLVGMLGSATGFLHVFSAVPAGIEGENSISNAILPMIAGLIVAIFSYWGYSVLRARVKKAEMLTEMYRAEFMDMLIEPSV